MGVLGFHVICTTYGFWVPDDQRGSGSDFVRKNHLLIFGDPTYVQTHRSVANRPFHPEIRRLAKESLKHPPVMFNGKQARYVALAIGDEIKECGGTFYAFSILPTHFHLVTTEHRYDIRRFAGRLKGAATKRLREEGLHPLNGCREKDGSVPSPWGRLPWVRYLWSDADMLRAIDYVENNPLKDGKRRQYWSLVTPWATQRGAAHRR